MATQGPAQAGWPADLEDLRWHWGEAYQITREHGMFRAVRRDDGPP